MKKKEERTAFEALRLAEPFGPEPSEKILAAHSSISAPPSSSSSSCPCRLGLCLTLSFLLLLGVASVRFHRVAVVLPLSARSLCSLARLRWLRPWRSIRREEGERKEAAVEERSWGSSIHTLAYVLQLCLSSVPRCAPHCFRPSLPVWNPTTQVISPVALRSSFFDVIRSRIRVGIIAIRDSYRCT